ncbi:hypothetical protein [Pseudomonas sp. PLMAX]|jgi:hypothetical protein|uniref:hypothetical protein n=1 Tax=Pseudomonas sp. PLMAX TaxID=2201998 RepID=UPI0038BD154E
MDQQSERKVVVGGIDVQANGYEFALAFDRAEVLEKQAHALYDEARALRAKAEVSVLITPAIGMPGQHSVTTRLGGEYFSGRLARSAEEACQIAFHIIQGFRAPLYLPPFGTPVDQTLPVLDWATDMCTRNQ